MVKEELLVGSIKYLCQGNPHRPTFLRKILQDFKDPKKREREKTIKKKKTINICPFNLVPLTLIGYILCNKEKMSIKYDLD